MSTTVINEQSSVDSCVLQRVMAKMATNGKSSHLVNKREVVEAET